VFEDVKRKRGNHVMVRDQIAQLAVENGWPVSEGMALMPTPNTMDYLPACTPEQKAANKGKGGDANVRETVINESRPQWNFYQHRRRETIKMGQRQESEAVLFKMTLLPEQSLNTFGGGGTNANA
jgi:hypothetical protein